MKPLRISDRLIRDSSVSFEQFVKRALLFRLVKGNKAKRMKADKG